MIENFKMNFINLKTNKQKVLNFVLYYKLESQKRPKSFCEVLERQDMKNPTKFELYTDDNKSKNSTNPKETLKSAKKLCETQPQVNFHSCYY